MVQDAVAAYMQKHGMVRAGDRLIVSVSGGPDSVALLHVLHSLAAELRLDLHVFHMEHGLRGAESAADASYVQALAARLGLPCTVARLAPGELKAAGGSVQARAREARHRALTALADQVGVHTVALGHNREDQAETVLLRLLRGAGPRGLAGMRPIRTLASLTLIRPLLATGRRAIEAYCALHELSPRVDPSNLRGDYARNRVRLQLLPLLAAEYNPGVVHALTDLAEICAVENDLLGELGRKAFDRCRAPAAEGVALRGDVLRTEPLAIARRVVQLAGAEVLGTDTTLGLDAVTQVLEAVERTEGSRTLTLPGGLNVLVEYGMLHFRSAVPPTAPAKPTAWELQVPGITRIPALGLRIVVARGEDAPLAGPVAPDSMSIVVDAARLPGPLAVRLRQPGDRLWPVGMEGSKKLQDILVDAKVPRRMRDEIPLLVSGDDVLWVIGCRSDRRYLTEVDAGTALVIRVEKP